MKKLNKVFTSGLSLATVLALTPSMAFAASAPAGATVGNETNGKYPVTFVYEDKDEKDATSVTVSGNFQWYSSNDSVVKGFATTGSTTGATVYRAEDYTDGMFNTGYGLNSDSQVYTLTEDGTSDVFETTLTVPGNLYYYDYTVTYADGSKVTMQDPANPSPANVNGHDAGHSIVYVGDKNNTTEGQEYIYERTDDKKGTYSYVTYTATDGTTQPLGVYLPYGYDSSKTYPTLYVSHGGGGNEAEWMTIGSLPNIMDNVMANGEMTQAVVVTMDNTYFKWNYDTIAKNFQENIIPYVENHYSVSKEAKNRALCGLSMGSMTTSTILQSYTELFGRYGAFSGANCQVENPKYDEMKNVVIYLTAGNVDMAYKATTDEGDVGIGGPAKTVGLQKQLDAAGVSYNADVKNGAHDWGVWRAALTTFAKDYLWEVETVKNESTVTPPATNSNTKPATSVKTGDDTNILGVSALLATSLVAMAYVEITKRKALRK